MERRTLPQGMLPSKATSGGLLNAVRHDGIRRLIFQAGITITPLDLSEMQQGQANFTFDDISEIALTLSLDASVKHERLSDLLLDTNLFAFETLDRTLYIFVPAADGSTACIAPDTGLEMALPDLDANGRSLVFSEPIVTITGSKNISKKIPGWLSMAVSGSRNSVSQIAIVTFIGSTLALALPLFTLAVYDQVLAAQNLTVLIYLSIGFGIAVIAEFTLRSLRSRILANASAYLDLKTSTTRNSRLFRTTATLARLFSSRDASIIIKDHERLSNIITGPIGTALLEIPVFFVYVAVLGILGSWLAIIPIVGLIAGGFGILRILSYANDRTQSALQRAEEYSVICDQIARLFPTIKTGGASRSWYKRFLNASARLAEAEMQRQRTFSYARIASNALGSIIVSISLAIGAIMVINQSLSSGALIAVVAIVWRLMAPVPSILEAILRRTEITNLIANANRAEEEIDNILAGEALGGQGKGIAGQVSFSSVLFNYQRGQAPALRNISVSITPGELIMITGVSGSGKSTFLDMIAGLKIPQLGTVTIDGVLPSQLSSAALLQSVSYLSRDHNSLPISIKEFMHFGAEINDPNDIEDNCHRAGILEKIKSLPDGFDTRLCDIETNSSLLHRIAVTRALSTGSRLILLDEPDASTVKSRKTFLSAISRLRNNSTIIVATHEPEYISAADRILIMNQGAIVRICTPKDIARQKEGVNQ
tara:strand:- start:20628 stop:22760 length:2133 start_codon:yes stop_codon:yes gene_type:complete